MPESVVLGTQSPKGLLDRHSLPQSDNLPYDPSQARIFVVHDLVSHRPTSGNQGEEGNVEAFSLENVLQRDLPRTNIMSFSPSSAVAPETFFTTKGLKDAGIELLNSVLEEEWRECRVLGRIIFVVWGMGNLIVKKALSIAQNSDMFESIRDRTFKLVSIGSTKPAIDSKSTEALALNLMGTSVERCRYSLSRTIEIFSAAITEVMEDFSSIAGIYETDTDEFLSALETHMKEYSYPEKILLKLNLPSEQTEDRLLSFSDKLRFLIKSESTSRGNWYPDYLLMLSELHRQQYTCKVVCENPQTLLWLFNHSTYLAWLGNNDPCTLYIYGQCGVGKTILSSFLWKNLQRMGQAEEDDAVTAVYFSFHHEDERRNSIKSLLSSIIYQLLVYQPQIFISIQVHFDWIRRSWPLTMEELWIVFRSLISHPIQGKIVCIIDAIDRCNVPFDATLRSLLAFTKSREARFKVVATSRRSPESLHHPPLFSINLDSQKEIRSDIQVCIKMHVHELLQDNRALLEFETQIVEDFQNRTTHLEIVLGFQSLKGPRLRSIPRYIRKTLQSLHYSPSEVCDQILNDFTKLEPWARIALSWITLAFRPLTFGELSIAVAIRETTISYSEVENDVSRDIARDLKQVFDAIICTKHDEIRFIHKSIKDCLLASLRSSNQQHPSLDLTHTDLARRCLTYLSFPDLEEYLASRPVKASSQAYSSPARFDMLGYALEYWPEHYQRAESKESLNGLALEFLKNDRNFERWNEHPTFEHFRQKRRSCSASPLQVATRLGLTEIVIMLLSEDGGGSITLNDKQAALDMSVEKGDKKITTELLNDGVTTPRVLSLAARHGNSELVKQLLNEGGTKGLENDESHDTDGAPDSQGNSDTDSVNATDGHSPLQIAALRGHTAVIHTLLEAGDSPELINTSGDTSFSLAVKGGQLAALKELLRGRSAIEIDFSLLHLAASQGHLEIVRELIRNGVDPNAIGKDGSTPLLLAAEGGRAELVKELINISRAVLEATNDAGSRAVHVAATNGHIQAFEHLCRAGADINAQDDDGSGPIHLAAKMGHLRVTKSLLESGVNSNIPDRSGFTPLHLATRGGYLRIVQELINHARSHPEAHPDPKLKSRVATGGLEETARDETKDFESSRDEGDAETDKFLDDHDNGHQHLDGSSDESLVSSDMLDYSDDESSSDFDDSHNLLKFQDSDEATPLHSAAARGYMEILRELLKNDAQYNKHGKHHRTPLHLAAREGYVSVVKELLQRSADPNTADLKQSSPLHAASTSGNLLMVKTLLEFGAAANKTDNNKISPLYQAARHGHVDVVKQLLEAGAELEATSALGQTSLQIAVSQRHSDVVAALLTKGANPNTTSRLGWTALHFAVSGKDIGTDLISKLIQFGVDVHASNDSGSTALFLAAERGSEAAVRLLLGAGARVDAKNTANSTPMHRAAQEGHLKVVKMLMEAGANPLAKKRRDITPLHLALENEHLDVAAQLLEPTNADIPSINDYEEILHLLAMVGFAEGITKALNYPLCNLERADSEYQQSPLSHAAERGHESVVQVLLNRGADPNSLDNTGKSPLSWAAWGGYEVVARQLLRNGADIQSKDHQQWTALHFAVVIGNVPTVDFLLGMGADLSATFDEGFTALHLAVGNDYLEVIQLLLEKGASIFSESLIHFTPLAFAVRWAGASTVKLLLDYGADCSSSSPETNFELKIAINRGDKDILDLLVHGCGDNIANQQGWTRLHLASFCGDKTSVREQLEQKVDRNVKDRDGLTALHLAAVQSHEDVVCLMLEMNTEVQSRDNEGMTTLHHAASTGTARMVTALLEKGAENNVIDLHGWNPLQIAQMYANNEICAILSADSETGMVPGTGSCLAPSHLVKAIESSQTTLSGHGLTVTTDTVRDTELLARVQVRANQPMPAGAYVFYFEVTIINAGSTNIVGVGFCEGNSLKTGMPGWCRGSWGYHGDDGMKFGGGDSGVLYGPTYGTGDTVGCGVDFTSRCAFFTKNGVKLETAFEDIKGRLYPVVGTADRDTKVTVNFGGDDFIFKDHL